MSFAWPLCFLLSVPLALAAWRMLRRGRRAGIKFAPVRRLPARTAGWRARVANLAPWFFLAGAALLIIAAARPRTSLARSSRSVDAIAIAMAVDVSGSMEALDFTPRGASTEKTRLDVVKEMFAKFVEARPDDLIGLVTFGGFASTRVPLTADHEVLLHVLKGVKVPSLAYDANGRPVDQEEQMTAIGDGLATAIARLGRRLEHRRGGAGRGGGGGGQARHPRVHDRRGHALEPHAVQGARRVWALGDPVRRHVV